MTEGHKEIWRVLCMFIILIMAMVSQTYVKTYQIVYFKNVEMTVCQLYLNETFKKHRKKSWNRCRLRAPGVQCPSVL